MPRPLQLKKLCSANGCARHSFAQGRCSMHYTRAVKTGEIIRTPTKAVNLGGCKVGGCKIHCYGAGYCQKHYEKFRKYGDPLGSAERKTGMNCTTPNCGGVVIARGMCANCYALWKRHGNPQARSEWYLKRYEEIIDDHGYVLVYVKGHPNANRRSRVPKHRFVMAQYLGRPLRKNENVHHKNGNKVDNSLENLELWVTAQPKGQRPQDLVEWARQILRDYALDSKKLLDLEYRNTK